MVTCTDITNADGRVCTLILMLKLLALLMETTTYQLWQY